MQVLQSNRLRADVTTAQRVIGVAANSSNSITLALNDDATYRLTQMASPVMSLTDRVGHRFLLKLTS